MPGTARAAGLLGVLGALPLAVLGQGLTPSGRGGATWLLFLVPPLLLVAGAVLLLAGRSRVLLVLACLPAVATAGLLFLVSGPDLGLLLGSLAQLGLLAVTLTLALQQQVGDWIADRAAPSAGGRRGPAASG